MKIIVTGGAGFIASHIVDAYIENGHEIVVIDDLSSGRKDFINKQAKFYKCDIRNFPKLKEIFRKEKAEAVNHHAAQISVSDSVDDPLEDASINISGLLNILEAGRLTGLKKVIFASSGGVVYGDAGIIPTPESYSPKKPLSPYGVTKLASEHYLHFYLKSYGIKYVALRYSNIYGPRQNPHGEAGVVAIFSRKLLGNKIPVINGNGKQTRDYLYVKDVVKVNMIALKSGKTGAFNVGTGIETDVNQLYKHMVRIIGKDKEASFGPKREGEQIRSCLDTRLAKDQLGWQPKITLKEGLSQTVNYFRENE